LASDGTDANKVADADSKWYTLKIELDFDNGTTTYYLDGAETAGASLEALGINGIQGISIGTNSNAVDASTLIDNVSVKHQYRISSLSIIEFGLVDETGTEVSYNNVNVGDVFYLKADIANVDDVDKKLMLALAKYRDNTLVEVDVEQIEIAVGDRFECGVGTLNEVKVSRPVDADEYCKIFVFDSDTFAPYAKAASFYDGERITLLFNNSLKSTDLLKQPPVNIMGIDYLPVSYIAKLIDYDVRNNDDRITLTNGENTIVIEENSDIAFINGDSVELPDTPFERYGEILVTADVIEEIFPIGEDVTEYGTGIALHTEYYSDETNFFNLITTFTGDPKTQRGFSWEATTEYSNMVIEYSEGDTIDNAISVKAISEEYPVVYNYTNQNSPTTDGISFYDNMLFYKATLDNLKPGTTYTYRIGDTKKNEWSSEYTFTTETDENDDFTIIAVADSQEQTVSGFDYYKNTLNTAVTETQDAAFVVHLGDIVENGMCDDWWNMFFEASKGINETLPLVPVVGNHETRINGTKYYNLHFNNPDNGKGLVSDNYDYSTVRDYEANVIRELDNTVYSFDYGNVHFAVLNTGTDWADEQWKTEGLPILELQKAWLKEDMAKAEQNGAKWKVVLMHIGVYTARERKSAYEFYNTIDECGIDLVLSGHDHVTMRTKSIYGDNVSEENGSVYAIMGSSGTKRYGFNSGTYEYINTDKVAVTPTETDAKNPTYNILTFTDTEISIKAKALDGTIVDEFSITK
ncbi:MAG: metallophosphoesterase, partial [Clostridia bacterium]|nr:metallophosphoesterase [Clostridia bacterium]